MRKEAQLFKSLADETRLKMLWLLMGREELCVCDIMGVLGITQSEVMHVGFPDPAQATGTEEEILTVFRWVRDGLRERLGHLLKQKLRERREKIDAAGIASA